jgi:CheY-like chemotaxis protein/DNA-binding beta-propeller fold protein YncE
MRILVVEDESRMAELLRQGLSEEGHSVTVARDGQEGLIFAQSNPFDLILLDLMLPRIDGIAVARRLRANQSKTPILMLTARDHTKDAELKGITQENENGKTVFEVETIKSKRTRDIVIDATGVMLEIEEETALDEIPWPAKAAIEKAAASGKVIKVETVKKGSSTFYEAAIKKGKKNSEIKVGADGTVIKQTAGERKLLQFCLSNRRTLMRMKYYACFAVIALVLQVLAAAELLAAEGPYRFITKIDVGGNGGWDYAVVDSPARRLYVTHGTKIVVIDTDKNSVAGEIADTPGVHGFALAPELGLGFSSNGAENKASIVDLKTLQTKSKVDTGANPDAILYDSSRKEVYTFNGRGKSATVFEAESGKIIATISLPGKPEFAQLDMKAGRIYSNIEDKNEVAVIDTKTHSVVADWPIAPGEGASGMAIDLTTHRLFLGAEKLMVMMDSHSGKVVATLPIGPGVDANSFDPETRLAFASCGGDGTVTVAREDAPDKLTLVQVIQTACGSRTMTLDPKTHRIYLAAADFEAPSAQGAPGQRSPRPQMVPNSFRILVYGTEEK